MAKILVTGGDGALGRTLAERVLRKPLDLSPSFPGPAEIVRLSRKELDCTQYNDVKRAVDRHRPDVVLYAAGCTDLALCEGNRWDAYLVNRDGADHAARSCADVGAVMVYFGTDLVFDGNRGMPYREEDPPCPSGTYADTKLAGELTVMRHVTEYLVIRTGWLFGPHHPSPVASLLDRLRTDDTVFACDRPVRQPTYVEDFLDALFRLLALGKSGTYHVAPSAAATEIDVAYEIARRIRPGAQVEPIANPGGRGHHLLPPYSVLDCSKLEAEGIKLPDWREALGRYLATVANA